MANKVFGLWLSLGIQSQSNPWEILVSSNEQNCEPPFWITYYFSRFKIKMAGGQKDFFVWGKNRMQEKEWKA